MSINKTRLRCHAERLQEYWGVTSGSVDFNDYDAQDLEMIENIMTDVYDEAINDAALAAAGISNPDHCREVILAQLKSKPTASGAW